MRFKSLIGISIVLLAISLVANYGFAQKNDSPNEETIICPVSGEKMLKSEAAGPYEHKGVKYYFCCNNCIEKFKKDPEVYLNRTKDIICGMTIDKRTASKVTYEGNDYYFCTDKCKAEFEKDPPAQVMKAMKALQEKSEAKDAKCCEHGDAKTAKTGEKKESCGDKAEKKPTNR